MARIALSIEQKKAHKLKDFKGWVVKQMKMTGTSQADLGRALGVSQVRISQMLKISDPKSKGRVNPDPFSYGQVLTLCKFFDVSDKEILRLMRL